MRRGLPRRRVREPMGVRQSSVIRCDGHLKWTRGNKCLVEGPHCWGRIEAHHVRENGNGGTGMKPGDDSVVALCAAHHRQLHDIGAETFQRMHTCDLDKAAEANWKASPHRLKHERTA
jgi:hypothetical protein